LTDITKIAAACANRIMDRMEMCRGSAILKSDIEREVEMALHEHLASLVQPGPLYVDLHGERIDLVEALTSITRLKPYPGWRFRQECGVLHHEPEPLSEAQEALRAAIVEDAMRRQDHAIDPPRVAPKSERFVSAPSWHPRDETGFPIYEDDGDAPA